METRTVTMRLPQDVVDCITSNGDSITDGVKEIVRKLQTHERYATLELKGKFVPKEWCFFADSLNGTMMQDDFRYYPDALIAHNQDAQLYDDMATKWGVDLDALNEKCKHLTAAQVEALYRRIEKFWEHPNGIDLAEWGKF